MSFLKEAKIMPAPDRLPPTPLVGVALREVREKARVEKRLLTEEEMADFRQAKPDLHWEQIVERWDGAEIKVLSASAYVLGSEERKRARLKKFFAGLAQYRFVFCLECQGWTQRLSLELPYDDGQCHYLVCGVCQTTLAQKRYRFID